MQSLEDHDSDGQNMQEEEEQDAEAEEDVREDERHDPPYHYYNDNDYRRRRPSSPPSAGLDAEDVSGTQVQSTTGGLFSFLDPYQHQRHMRARDQVSSMPRMMTLDDETRSPSEERQFATRDVRRVDLQDAED